MYKTWTVIVALNLLISSSLLAQPKNESPYVFQIRCKYYDQTVSKNKIALQTGFSVADGKGIVTALHGVVKCFESEEKISAYARGGGKNQDGLRIVSADIKIVSADIKNDVALLSSEIEGGLSIANCERESCIDYFENREYYVLGYPWGDISQRPTSVKVRPKLKPIENWLTTVKVTAKVKKDMEDRQSPDIKILMFDVEGHLLPGHSGAPIVNKKYEVIGVANGGLGNGTVEMAWAIPYKKNLQLKQVSEIARELNVLKSKSIPKLTFLGNSSDWISDELKDFTKRVIKGVKDCRSGGCDPVKIVKKHWDNFTEKAGRHMAAGASEEFKKTIDDLFDTKIAPLIEDITLARKEIIDQLDSATQARLDQLDLIVKMQLEQVSSITREVINKFSKATEETIYKIKKDVIDNTFSKLDPLRKDFRQKIDDIFKEANYFVSTGDDCTGEKFFSAVAARFKRWEISKSSINAFCFKNIGITAFPAPDQYTILYKLNKCYSLVELNPYVATIKNIRDVYSNLRASANKVNCIQKGAGINEHFRKDWWELGNSYDFWDNLYQQSSP